MTDISAASVLSFSDQNGEFEEAEQLIQSLTTILQQLDRRRHATGLTLYTPIILKSIATLLTCDDQVAVTGALTSDAANIVIAKGDRVCGKDKAESPRKRRASSGGSLISLDHIPLINSTGSLPEAPPLFSCTTLQDRASLVWGSLTSTDFNSAQSLNDLCLFVLRISLPQFWKRFSIHLTLFPGLWRTLLDWRPLENEIFTKQVADVAELDGDLLSEPLPVTAIREERMSQEDAEIFAAQLVKALVDIETAFLDLKEACRPSVPREVPDSAASAGLKPEQSLIRLNQACIALTELVRDGTVEALFETSLKDWIRTTLPPCCVSSTIPHHLFPGITTDIHTLLEENRGDQVLRYIKNLVSWHLAVYELQADANLLKEKPPDSVKIAIVEQSLTSGHALLPLPTLVNILVERRDKSDPRSLHGIPPQEIVDLLSKSTDYTKQGFFDGDVHAEMTLQGLIAFFNRESHRVAHNVEIRGQEQFRQMLKECHHVGLNWTSSCCYSCLMVGADNAAPWLKSFPSTNGVIVPWTPARVGFPIAALLDLKDFLLEELEGFVHWNIHLQEEKKFKLQMTPQEFNEFVGSLHGFTGESAGSSNGLLQVAAETVSTQDVSLLTMATSAPQNSMKAIHTRQSVDSIPFRCQQHFDKSGRC